MDHAHSDTPAPPATGPAITDPPSPTLDKHIGVALRYAYQRAIANLSARIGEFGISPVQYSILIRLSELGPLSQNRLGRSISMEPANIGAVVQRLASRGLVDVRKDPGDRRMLLVGLTATGEELLEEVRPRAEVANATTLSCLSGEEQRQLFDLLRRITNAA